MPPTIRYKFGINNEKAILFYTNPETRRLYREHLEKIATRTNTITGIELPRRSDDIWMGIDERSTGDHGSLG